MTFDELRDNHNKEATTKRSTSFDEANTQAEFFKWLGVLYPEFDKLIFHVPNEGKRNGRFVKRSGIKKGVSDVVILIPNKEYHGFCIEFKTDKGKQSADQKEFQRQVEDKGYKYIICKSAGDAINEVKQYLKLYYYE